jgi:uncharacterized glyoxalase superfamily metalloenzyme YdcJ
LDCTDFEEESNKLVQNVWKYLPVNHPKILETKRIFVFTTRHLAVDTAAYGQLVQQQAHTEFMWGKSLEKFRFGDRRNEKNRDETTIRIPGALAEIQT